MAQLNRENWADYLWPNYNKIIGEGYQEKPEKFREIFAFKKTDRAYVRISHIGTLPPWRRNNEGNTLNESEKVLGPEVIIYVHRYDNSFIITHEYFEDNQKAVMQGLREGRNAPRELGAGIRKVREEESAKVINQGFTNIGYDGVPLFSDAHPLAGSTEVVSNLAPAGKSALTNDNMEEAIKTMETTQKDETGYRIQVIPDMFVCSPDLQFHALRIFHSAQIAGTNWNDKNVLPAMKVISWDYLDAGIWFFKDSSYENLMFYEREAPTFDYEKIQGKIDYRFYGYTRFGVGYIDWRGLYGAKIA